MVRKLPVLLVLALVTAIAVGCGGTLGKDGVARVGEILITRQQLDQRISELQAQYQGQVPTKDSDADAFQKFERQVLDSMVTSEVQRQSQAQLGVSVTDEEVAKQVELIKQMFQGDEAKFQQALEKWSLTPEQLTANLREQEIDRKVTEAVTKNVKVTEEQVQAYYDENKDAFKVAETRKARHILLSPGKGGPDGAANATAEEWNAALTEANKVRQEIANGADFAAKAKEHSDDAGSKELGGALGNLARGSMVAEFDEALFALKKAGDLSKPVKTKYGYHIILLEQINVAKQQTFAEVKDRIRDQLLSEAKRAAWSDWLSKTKKDLGVEYKEGLEPLPTITSTTARRTNTSS